MGRRSLIGIVLALAALVALPAGAQARRLHVRVADRSAPKLLRHAHLRLVIRGRPHEHVVVSARIRRGRHSVALVHSRSVRLGRHGSRRVRLRLAARASKPLRAAIARCHSVRVTARAKDHRRHARTHRRLSGGRGCHHAGGIVVPGQGPRSGSSPTFRVGAAVSDFTPPLHGRVPGGDAADCDPTGGFDGKRIFAFEEPYKDQNGNDNYDLGEPYLDCNHNGRWEGDYLGGGDGAPRHYNHVADPVTSRALVVSNGSRTVAVEVTDQEGLFNVYQQQIRDKVAADGYHLDGIFISATHDESAPDTLGINGENQGTSSVNDYFNAWLVEKSAKAIEAAYDARRPAHLRYADALEPANMRQCWSSYPFVDDHIMPVLQAVGTDGRTIATLASVSQHAETLGFNPDPVEKRYISGDWPYWFRTALEQRYGGVGIEMAGSVGSVESPEVFPFAISRVPQQTTEAPDRPAGCRTLFNADDTKHAALGYNSETRLFGQQLAGAVEGALDRSATLSGSSDVWGERADACVPLSNQFFGAAATAGVFAHRPGYTNNCQTESPVAPNGSTSGNEIKTEVAAFRLGDGEFISLPGEVFPFTYMRGFLSAEDMPNSQYDLPAWPLPHMNAPYRFFDGLAEDMIGYIFPRGNTVSIPGDPDSTDQTQSGDDRFGCHHSDDGEAASSQAGDILADPLVGVLGKHDAAESVTKGRYVLPDGTLSRDPLGGPVLKCNTDTTYHPNGPAVAVELPNGTIAHPAAWMALDGRPQSRPDRNTRGYFTGAGRRVWLDVFPAL